LLGLRALFLLVSGMLDRLVYLSTGLSLILAFIGVKLILHSCTCTFRRCPRSRPASHWP
jgi:predicted tellurium resistance membrane protein TerC